MTISIHSSGTTIELESGKHHINLIGCFGIELNGFSVALKNTRTLKKTTARKAFWPIQSFWKGERSKRILSIEVPSKGIYEVLFHNSDQLVVRRGNLISDRLFTNPLDTSHLKIKIK